MFVERTIVAFAMLLATTTSSAAPLETTFTYQGELRASGAPATGNYDFDFGLFDAQSGGNQIGPAFEADDVTVNAGVFSVELDFGAAAFAGEQLWLEIGVRDGASAGGYQGLAPRQKLTAAPYALHAEMVAANAIAGAEIANNSITAADLAGNSVAAAEIAANAVGQSELAANSVGSSEVINNSLTAADLANNSVAAAELAANSVGTSEIITAQVQRRVSGDCDPGTYLSGVNENGSVQCSDLPLGLAHALDSSALYTSITIRQNGLPIISYFGVTEADLKVYDCTNAICSTGIARTLDSDGVVGGFSSIAIRRNGRPIISYFDTTNRDLKVYDCSNITCSAGTARVLDSLGNVGIYTSLAIGNTGNPVIGYSGNSDLKIYVCGDAACSTGSARTLDSAGEGISLAIRNDGRPILSYFDRPNRELKAYDCTDTQCSAGQIRTLTTSNLTLSSNIVIRPSGLPHIAYGDRADLKFYECTNPACSSGGVTSVRPGTGGDNIRSISQKVGGDGFISAVYPSFEPTNQGLTLLKCISDRCFGPDWTTITQAGPRSTSVSLAIRPNGLPIVSYLGSDQLRVFSCADPNCAR